MTSKTRAVFNPAIESLDRKTLLHLQWKKLAYQLDYLERTNEFYRERFRQAGVRASELASLEEFRERVPLCDKTDLLEDQNAAPPFGNRLGIRPRDVRMTYMTSGTSGVGQEVYGHSWSDALAAGAKCVEAPFWPMGLRSGDRVFIMVPVATLAFGLMAMETTRLGGYTTFPAFNLDSQTKLKTMQRFDANCIVATPTHLARLTTIAHEMGIEPSSDVPNLKGILLAGQAYPIELGLRLSEQWNAPIHETYGSSQGNGFTACTCEQGAILPGGERGAMHVFEHRCLVEILNPDTLEPVAPGEEGMAVVTNLDAEGSPLVRFRMNDKVRYLGTDCACGRQWSMIEAGTISRYDEMLKIRGMNIWPQTVDDVILGSGEVEEYVAEVFVDEGNLEQVQVKFALTEAAKTSLGPTSDGLHARLVTELKQRTNVTFHLTEVERHEIPVFEFKAVRWHDRRQADLVKKVW